MRLREHKIYKISFFLICAVLLLVINNIFERDEFFTESPLGKQNYIVNNNNAINKLRLKSYGNWTKNRLLNLTNFNYLINNTLCEKHSKDILAILIITSYAGHVELRAAHREAISQVKLNELGFKRVFLLAEIPSTENSITQAQLENEQERFGDLLQGNFQEAYRNLSYKNIMGLQWAATECSKAKFIVKLDDDTVYDVFQLHRYLKLLEEQETKLAFSNEFLTGYILDANLPIRNITSKWYVTMKEFIGSSYPPYLSGMLYITNKYTALRLVQTAMKSRKIFWIDDVWVTGILRAELNIPMQPLNSWYAKRKNFMRCCVRDLKQFNFECEYFIGRNGGNSKMIVDFLHNVEKCYFNKCIKRPSDKTLYQTCVDIA